MSVDTQVQLFPNLRLLEEPNVLTKCEVCNALGGFDRRNGTTKHIEVTYGYFASDKPSDMEFYFSEK